MGLNDASANSIMDSPADNTPNDGTGQLPAPPASAPGPLFTDPFAGICQLDGYLDPFKPALRSRYAKAQQWLKTIQDSEGGLDKFTRARRARTSPFGYKTANGCRRGLKSTAST